MPVLTNRKNFQLRTGSWVRRIVHKDGPATGIQSAIGGTLLYTLPLRFFTAGEARVVPAACARIFPTDASVPAWKVFGKTRRTGFKARQ